MNPKGFSFEMDHLRTRSHGRYLTPLPWTSAGIRVWIFCRRLGENSRRRYSTVTEFFCFVFFYTLLCPRRISLLSFSLVSAFTALTRLLAAVYRIVLRVGLFYFVGAAREWRPVRNNVGTATRTNEENECDDERNRS